MSYSQIGQDDWVLKFAVHKYFVDVGGCDGVTGSNTKLLEEQGWHGGCVEPGPVFSQMRKARQCECVQACVWRTSAETLEFQACDDPQLSGILSTLQYVHPRHLILVRAISLMDLLVVCGAPSQIGYLSVDTEGSELEILNAFDWSFQFDCISFEHNGEAIKKLAVRKLLREQGYELFGTVLVDDWFLRKELAPL
jgi:Methyltransferase FkbM domain